MKPTPQTRLSVIAADLRIGLGAVLFGEGGDDPSRISLFGTVNVDGKPLERGTIGFFLISPSPKDVSGGGLIDRGRFVLNNSDSLVPGTYLVVIRQLPDTAARHSTGKESETRPLTERDSA